MWLAHGVGHTKQSGGVGGVGEVGIDLAGGGWGGVAEGFSDLKEGDALLTCHRGKGVA